MENNLTTSTQKLLQMAGVDCKQLSEKYTEEEEMDKRWTLVPPKDE